MLRSALEFLACPACHGALRLAEVAVAEPHVMTGSLSCNCGVVYPIEGGVPRLVHSEVASESTTTASRFGDEWTTFDHRGPHQERWLRQWLAPLGPDDFADKVVLEAGCGNGRHTSLLAGWGARAVVALDLGHSVDVAFRETRHLPNVHVVQGDILHPPLARCFDVAISIGVLHHLPDPRAGFDQVWRLVRAGGKVAIWVYGYESNEWIVRWVNPVRERVTSRIPHRLLYWATLPPSIALATVGRIYSRSALAQRLPYRDYMSQLGRVPIREVHGIVFDQLVTPIAYYLPESEVRSWFDVPELGDATFAWHNRNSWRAQATVLPDSTSSR